MSVESYKYTEDHEWIHFVNGVATVGLSKHAIDELGEIVYVELPDVNKTLTQKDEFGTVESVKTVSSLYLPVSGEITEVNSELENTPDLISSAPLEEGWLLKLKPSDESEFDDLMTSEEYENYLETL